MVEVSKVSIYNTSDYNNYNTNVSGSEYENTDENVQYLQEQLSSAEAENGVFLESWNNLKEATGIGTSVSKCDEAITKYQNGEITFEEASEIIDNYEDKQESSLNLFSNIATSIAAIGVAALAASGVGTPLALIAIGAATGAAAKAGFKTVDRATNEVEGDALDGEQIAKDALSGAVVGGTAAATMGTMGQVTAADSILQGAAKGAAAGAKTGLITGAISGGSNYAIDCVFDEDKDFNIKEFASVTAESSLVGAAVGTVMGGGNGILRSSGILNSGCSVQAIVESSDNASIQNVAANSVCTASYKVLNDRFSAII